MNVAATLYNLEAQGASGYGGLLSAYLPFWNARITVRPSASMRWLDPAGDGLLCELPRCPRYATAVCAAAGKESLPAPKFLSQIDGQGFKPGIGFSRLEAGIQHALPDGDDIPELAHGDI